MSDSAQIEAPDIKAQELQRAFDVFNQVSLELTQAYEGLQARVETLTAELAIANRQQREEIRRREQSEARFRDLFEQNSSVMMLIDPASGAIVDANRSAIDFYGYARDELLHMSISAINTLPPEEIAKARERGECKYFEFKHRLASGEERDVEVHITPIGDNERPLLVSIVNDVSARRRAERELEQYRGHLEELVASRTAERPTTVKTRFVSGAHQLLRLDEPDGPVESVHLPLFGAHMAENAGGDGICKVIADTATNRLVGCHIIGNYASEIITSAAMLIESEMKIEDIKEFIFPHPSVAEIIREAIFQL